MKRYDYTKAKNFFRVIDTKEKSYHLGFISADGHIFKGKKKGFSVKLSVKDVAYLEMLKRDMTLENDIHIGHSKHPDYPEKVNTMVNIDVNNVNIGNDLINLGLHEKSKFLNVPTLKKNLLSHYVRGLTDGDGWISHNVNNGGKRGYKFQQYRWGLCGTKTHILEIASLIEGILGVKIYHRQSSNLYSIEVRNVKDVLKLLKWIYKDSKELRLERKYEKYLEIKKLSSQHSWDKVMRKFTKEEIIYIRNSKKLLKEIAEEFNIKSLMTISDIRNYKSYKDIL